MISGAWSLGLPSPAVGFRSSRSTTAAVQRAATGAVPRAHGLAVHDVHGHHPHAGHGSRQHPGLAGRRIAVETADHIGRRGAGQHGDSVTAFLTMHRRGIAEGGELGDREILRADLDLLQAYQVGPAAGQQRGNPGEPGAD